MTLQIVWKNKMKTLVLLSSVPRGLGLLAFLVTTWFSSAALALAPPDEVASKNAPCLACHDGKSVKHTKDSNGEKRELHAVPPEKFQKSVHANVACVTCHVEIKAGQVPHKISGATKKPDCAECHISLWVSALREGKLEQKPGLNVVMRNIEVYKQSSHAKPNVDNPDVPNATCHDCHDDHTFNVAPSGSPEHDEWHHETPKVCGENCHAGQLGQYVSSVHGKELLQNNNHKAAACIDCHTTHAIGSPTASPIKLEITKNCGGCHEENFKTYRATYHGQVSSLGYAYTAKCFDCHGSHDVRRVDDPKSKVHPDKRLKTCQKCHNDKKPGMNTATEGFLTFSPHANSHDFAKYPQMWIVTKFMIALLIGVFVFFWLHSALWYYREWKEQKEGKVVSYIRAGDLPVDEKKFFQRFPWGWRVAHLVFALVTMTLVLTGTTALFAETAWAPVVAKWLGGPHTINHIHRIVAGLFVAIFFTHFIYVMQKLLRDKNFRWFGPDSLIPNWKDLRDAYGMFKWFLGKGPKPMFDRWTYFEKFDYWAVFWGVTIIGTSGLMLALPHVTATYLPGWVFNVATVVHAEEAFLAAVFLFTVHFFNNHFRPDKLPPPDIVMFTGAQSLEEFRRDHPAQYQRLVDAGELEKYLVDAPSMPMTLASKILGIVLILFGLTLLALVAIGFFGGA
jgi:cytochrome b subunit of formate dehydrogenase